METTTTLLRKKGLLAAPMDNEVVILNMPTNNYIALDATGRRIWELLENPLTIDDLCHILSLQFKASPAAIAADVLPFLADMRAEGLLHEHPASLA